MSDNGTASEPAHESSLHGLHVLSMVVYSLTFLLGTAGNGLVIWITGFKMKKTVNTVWFLNLAVADFVFTAFLPLTIATNALGFRWVFGGFVCKLNSGVLVTTMYGSVFLLAAISLDRCVSVVAAVWAHNFRTVRKAYLACFLLWAAALLMSSPYFAFRDAVEIRNVTYCSFRHHSYSPEALSSTLKTLTLVRFLFAFVFPFLVIVSCYVLIAQRYRATQRQRSYKPLRIVVAVVLTFFVCWLPFHVLQLVELRAQITDDSFLWMLVTSGWAHNFRTVRKAYLACFLLWAAALLMSSPYFAFRDAVEIRNVTYCSFRHHSYSPEALSSTLKTLTLVRFLFAFVFPFLVIVSCYVLIAQRYRATQRQRSYKPLRIVVAVVLTFFVCWLPFHVLQLVELRAQVTDDSFLWMLVDFGMPIATGLAFFNSCMNPILYVCMCQDFREKFRKSFLLVIESAFVEEGTLNALSTSRRSTVQMESLVNGNKQDSTAG
ncbi:UNVERIFIED_CONTAM: hypothetical protein FKN15_010380 [Acipenser sinensis]